MGELQTAGALKHSAILSANLDQRDDKAMFLRKLKQTVVGEAMKEREKLTEEMVHTDTEEGKGAAEKARKKQAIEEDDLFSPISIETYVEFRVRPFALRLEQRAPRIVRTLLLLESAIFLTNTLAGILALLPYGLTAYVSICVTVSTTFSSIIEYHQLQRLVPATNAALRDVHNMLTWWAALSMVDRRTRLAKQHAVSVLENAGLSLVAAVTLKGASQGDTRAAAVDEEGE